MVGRLKSVLVRAPDTTIETSNYLEWGYKSRPNLNIALNEHQRIVEILNINGVKVYFHDMHLPDMLDAVFVHDPCIITDHGAIILSMGKRLRNGEENAIESSIGALNIPILYKVHGFAKIEGGDIIWLDEKTLVIGRGYRTNQEGIDQVKAALYKYGVQVLQVDLIHGKGPEDCLHLQSMISFISRNEALVYLKYLPASLVELLNKRFIKLLEVPEKEYESLGSNVLTIKKNVVMALENNFETITLLRTAGYEVYPYKGDELCIKGSGGITCLTRPILREV